ncbi:MAG: 4-hydroxythreonine-4-phosphate dehydrogenase, partial [Piscirickettsiaceae bacterium]
MFIPRIAITTGEPAGIGPDICLQISQLAWPCQLVFIADTALLKRRAKQLNLNIEFKSFEPNTPAAQHTPGLIYVYPVLLPEKEVCGQLNTNNSSYVIETLTIAAQLCKDNVCSALVTAPVQKSIINDAGIAFTGHTEFFADYCASYPVMMLQTQQLRVALATTHIPLSKVSETITEALLIKVINIINDDLKSKFSIKKPKIAVCGLNPHAGESGHLGHEELQTIIPALNTCRETGIHITGPLP